MRAAIQIVVVGAVLVGAVLIVSGLPEPKVRLRACGHREDYWAKLSRMTSIRFGATHCCSSGSMINQLRAIAGAQDVYKMDHGIYATSLDQITNFLAVYPDFEFRLASDGERWSVSVPQQSAFAGNYLLSADHLYFNKTREASTNDLDLWRRNWE